MIAMSTRLNELLLDENAHLGDMMQKALRYLNKFWKQLQGSLKNNKKLSQIECVLPERAARLCRLPKQEPFGAIRQNWLLTEGLYLVK